MRLFSTLALATLALACNTAKLTPMPDGGIDCSDPVPEYPCQALDGGGQGCTGELGSPQTFGRDVAVSATYPVGCTLFVNDPVSPDTIHCTTRGSCHCEAADGGYAWTCF